MYVDCGPCGGHGTFMHGPCRFCGGSGKEKKPLVAAQPTTAAQKQPQPQSAVARALAAVDVAQLELAKKLEASSKAHSGLRQGGMSVAAPKLDLALEKFLDVVGTSLEQCRVPLLSEREVEFVVAAVRATWTRGDRP